MATDNSNIYVVGSKDSAGFRRVMMLVKYDLSGNIIWEKYYTHTFEDFYLRGILIDSSSNVIIGVTEITSLNNMEDFSIFKFDPNGNLLWKNSFNGPTNNTDELENIRIDSHNNIYAFGYSIFDNLYYYRDAVAVKFNSNGILQWAKTYYGGGEGYTLDLDYARIAKILSDAGYTGYCCLEFEGKENPDIAVPRSLEVLRRTVGI